MIGTKTSWLNHFRKEIELPIFVYVKTPIPHSLKWAVWKRDDFTCKTCGNRDDLSIDHKTAESVGGELTLDNLQTLCRSCNSKKGIR